MKILVTGTAGFIASHLAERLADLNHEVIGLDCFTDYYSPRLKQLNAADLAEKGIPIYKLDLARDDLAPALNGVEFIFHLAAQPGISAITPFKTYVRNNVQATHNLVVAARKHADVTCFVNVATSSVYGKYATSSEQTAPKPTSYYGVTKLAAEQLVLSYQRERRFPSCSLRIFSVLGPRERPEKLYTKLIRSILMDEPFPLFDGSLEHSRSYTAVTDIVKGFVAVLNQPDKAIGEIFNIGSDKEISTRQGIAIVEKIMGKKAVFDVKPKRTGDQHQTCADITKARRILGYEPTTNLEEILQAQVNWYTERIYNQGLQDL